MENLYYKNTFGLGFALIGGSFIGALFHHNILYMFVTFIICYLLGFSIATPLQKLK